MEPIKPVMSFKEEFDLDVQLASEHFGKMVQMAKAGVETRYQQRSIETQADMVRWRLDKALQLVYDQLRVVSVPPDKLKPY